MHTLTIKPIACEIIDTRSGVKHLMAGGPRHAIISVFMRNHPDFRAHTHNPQVRQAIDDYIIQEGQHLVLGPLRVYSPAPKLVPCEVLDTRTGEKVVQLGIPREVLISVFMANHVQLHNRVDDPEARKEVGAYIKEENGDLVIGPLRASAVLETNAPASNDERFEVSEATQNSLPDAQEIAAEASDESKSTPLGPGHRR